VKTVLLELSTELICDNMPLASPAITTPLRPAGTSSRTSNGNAWSVSFSPEQPERHNARDHHQQRQQDLHEARKHHAHPRVPFAPRPRQREQ